MNKYTFIYSILLCFNSTLINAAVVYSYTSNPYEIVHGNYDTSTILSAEFTMENELLPYLTYQLFTPLSFSFTDERMTINNNSSYLSQQYFEVSTDSIGQITSWVMYATASSPTEYIGASTSTREDESWNGEGGGYVLYQPNTWSVTTVPVPGALLLFISGIAGLLLTKKIA